MYHSECRVIQGKTAGFSPLMLAYSLPLDLCLSAGSLSEPPEPPQCTGLYVYSAITVLW